MATRSTDLGIETLAVVGDLRTDVGTTGDDVDADVLCCRVAGDVRQRLPHDRHDAVRDRGIDDGVDRSVEPQHRVELERTGRVAAHVDDSRAKS